MKPLIGVTMGDPSGVGPEILLRFARKIRAFQKANVVVFGDFSYLRRVFVQFHRSNRSLTFPFVPVPLNSLRSWNRFQKRSGIPVVDLNEGANHAPQFGKPTRWGGRASGRYIKSAAEAALRGEIDAMVTLPINKEAFYWGGWGKRFPDHTQMLASLAKSRRTVLMMVHGNFRVSHVTQHIPLREVAGQVTSKAVEETILLTEASLRQFGLTRPKIGVCGLNPHAGDGGILGFEEKRVIGPVIQKLKKRGLLVYGPISADALWPRVLSGEFDAGVAMYHDQGQIPLKLIAARTREGNYEPGGVNVTLGLPFIRTSVAHGTAYDIAGRGKMSGRSFFEALSMAAALAVKRKK